MLSEVSTKASQRRAVKGTASVHRRGGRGIYFLLILACLCDLSPILCCPQRREEALKSRVLLLSSPPEGCSIDAAAAAGSSPWHPGTAV